MTTLPPPPTPTEQLSRIAAQLRVDLADLRSGGRAFAEQRGLAAYALRKTFAGLTVQQNRKGTPMQADDYQHQAARTLIAGPDADYTPEQVMLVWNALGLAGEAGEVADTIKKAVFHRHGLDRDLLIKELGDVLWYVAALCSKLDVPLSEVMERNIAKLRKRYPDGYSAADSLARRDIVG